MSGAGILLNRRTALSATNRCSTIFYPCAARPSTPKTQCKLYALRHVANIPLHPPHTFTAAPPHDRKGLIPLIDSLHIRKRKPPVLTVFPLLCRLSAAAASVSFSCAITISMSSASGFFMTFLSHPRPASVFPSAYCRAIHSAPTPRVSRRGSRLQKVYFCAKNRGGNSKKSQNHR